jgi:arsenite oxidase large subunit
MVLDAVLHQAHDQHHNSAGHESGECLDNGVLNAGRTFMETKWRGLQAPGKEAEKSKFPFLVKNGRTNIVWQNAYLDQGNEFVMDRFPYPFIQMNPQDMAELNVNPGDLVEVYNDNGSTQAVAYPTPSAKRKQTFMLFAYPTGVQGNVVSAG